MELPYGAAYLRPLRRPGVLIAGSTGIAPMPPIRILFGANRPADLAAGDTVADLVEATEGADYVPIVVADDASWLGAAGLVTDAPADRIGAPE